MQRTKDRLPETLRGATDIALKNEVDGPRDNARASKLMAQAQVMTGLKPGDLARALKTYPSVLWKERNDAQDMGSLRRLISMLEIITTNRGEEATFDLDDFEIVVRRKER